MGLHTFIRKKFDDNGEEIIVYYSRITPIQYVLDQALFSVSSTDIPTWHYVLQLIFMLQSLGCSAYKKGNEARCAVDDVQELVPVVHNRIRSSICRMRQRMGGVMSVVYKIRYATWVKDIDETLVFSKLDMRESLVMNNSVKLYQLMMCFGERLVLVEPMLVLLSTQQIERISTKADIRMLPADVLRRLYHFLVHPVARLRLSHIKE